VSLLRSVDYSLRWLVWAKTEDGSRGRNCPEPVRFPWEHRPRTEWTGDLMTRVEADALMGITRS
jgi:hypothetical protein